MAVEPDEDRSSMWASTGPFLCTFGGPDVGTVTVRDETPEGDVAHEWSLEFLNETITVRELIRVRVYQEVRDHNVRQHGFSGPQHRTVKFEAGRAILDADPEFKVAVLHAALSLRASGRVNDERWLNSYILNNL
jgi:hypothetical protein